MSKVGVQGMKDGKGFPTSFLVKHSVDGNTYNVVSENGKAKVGCRLCSSITHATFVKKTLFSFGHQQHKLRSNIFLHFFIVFTRLNARFLF